MKDKVNNSRKDLSKLNNSKNISTMSKNKISVDNDNSVRSNNKSAINNNKNSNKKNTKSSGLGNSLFKGQKFIDFQEPFNESIRPIRNNNLNRKNSNSILNSPEADYENESKWNDVYETENINFEQVEMGDNNEIKFQSENENQVQEKEKEQEFYSNNGNDNEGEEEGQVYFDNYSNNIIRSPVTNQQNDQLIKRSKYFNNLNVPNQRSTNQNFISTTSTMNFNNKPNSELFYKDAKKSSHDSTKANSNLYGTINVKNNQNNQNNQNLENNYQDINNLDFINTLVRLKSGLKSDTSMMTSNNNYAKNDDESKSYIKEILDMCSGSGPDNKINEMSNFEIKNYDMGDTSSINSNNINNSSSFINYGNSNSQNYLNNFNQNFNNNVNSNLNANVNVNVNVQSVNKTNQPKSLKIDDLIEITNKRKNMVGNVTSNDAYLRRRHLESLTKIENLKKEKDQREVFDFKFTPELNKKNTKRIIKSNCEMRHPSHKSSDRIIEKFNPNDIPFGNFYDKGQSEIDYIKSERKPRIENKYFNKNELISQIDDVLNEERNNKKKGRRNSSESVRYERNDVQEILNENKNFSVGVKNKITTERVNIKNNQKIIYTPATANNSNISSNISKPTKNNNNNNNNKQGIINLEINNRIYIPHLQTAIKPTIDTPNYKNFILKTEEMVNYGTKPHNNTKSNEVKILDNFKNNNNPALLNDYESNKNFMFSYDSNKINREIKDIHNNNYYNELDYINNINYINNNQYKETQNNYVNPNVIKTQQAEEEQANDAIDHIEINLFDNSNLNINNVKESVNSRSIDNTKNSYMQLFPVSDKSGYKMEDNVFKVHTVNTVNTLNTLNTLSSIQNNEKILNQNNIKDNNSNVDFKFNYNTHLNSDVISDDNDNSEVNEYNSDMNQKQNESANLNLYLNTNNNNNNTDKDRDRDRDSNHNNKQSNISTTNDNVSLNFSKFTNFVGMSEQYSKRTFNTNKILNNNYYSNILAKKEVIGVNNNYNNIPNNDISNRNSVHSYLSNEVNFGNNTATLNKNALGKTIGNNSLLNLVKENNNNHVPMIAEINLSDDELINTQKNSKNETSERDLKIINYFEQDIDNLLISANKIANSAKDKILVTSLNATGIGNNFNVNIPERKNENENENEINIDYLITPKYLFPKSNYEKPKTNPFTMGNKKLSRSLSKININSEREKEKEKSKEKNTTNIVKEEFTVKKNATKITERKDNTGIKYQVNKRNTICNNKNITKIKDEKYKQFKNKISNSPIKNIKISNKTQNNFKSKNEKKENLLQKENLTPNKTNNSSQINLSLPIDIGPLLNKTEGQIEKIIQNKSVLIIEKQNIQDYITEDYKPRSTTNSNAPYDYSKFSLDIMNTNASNKSKLEPPYNYMNEIVSNTIQMHRQSQENCQKQINELLNKINTSQEEHEANIKRDLNNLNMNESSLSNILRDNLSTSIKYEYEVDLDNFLKKV